MFKSIRLAAASSKRPAGPLVVGVTQDSNRVPSGIDMTDEEREAVRDGLNAPGFKAENGELVWAGSQTILLGLGEADAVTADSVRQAAGRLVKFLDRAAPRSVRLAVHQAIGRRQLAAEQVGRAVAEGMQLANWRVDQFQGSASKLDPPHGTLTLSVDDKTVHAGLKRGLALADATNTARRLAATPPNFCFPQSLADEARKLARSHKSLTCRVITFEQAKKMGLGGIVNVGMASAQKPCLIMLEHKPARPVKGEKLALVGKTITYDTGGYSLKISGGMKGMKYDKCGGCTVFGAMQAIAELNLPVHVVGLLPAAENMIAGDAYRPDDIITLYNGVTVEVTNTDAEGRLVLADALAYACKEIKPTAIVDVATLTGGIVVALGHFCSGVFTNDDGLMDELDAASQESGEKIWRMPLWPEHREFMRARHCDIWNSAPSRNGHPIQGAAFLSYFVDEDVPWAHVDIAGVASVDSDRDLYVQGPTGYGVRLLTDWVAGHAGS